MIFIQILNANIEILNKFKYLNSNAPNFNLYYKHPRFPIGTSGFGF